MTMHDLADMLDIFDCKETLFGERQFFKLRYIDISNNSEIKDFEKIVKKRLDKFYGVQEDQSK